MTERTNDFRGASPGDDPDAELFEEALAGLLDRIGIALDDDHDLSDAEVAAPLLEAFNNLLNVINKIHENEE